MHDEQKPSQEEETVAVPSIETQEDEQTETLVEDVEAETEVEVDDSTPPVIEYESDEHRDDVSPYASAVEDEKNKALEEAAFAAVLGEIEESQDTEVEYLDKVPHNITIERDVQGTLPKAKDGEEIDKRHYVSFLRHSVEEFNKLAEAIPKTELISAKEGAEWAQAIKDGIDNLVAGNALLKSLSKETSNWMQSVEIEGVRLAAGAPKISGEGENGKLSGDAAMFQVLGALGLGSIVQIPLWHSGIWVSIKAPTDSDLLLLDQRLADEKIALGNMTSGLVYSNTSVYMVNHLVNFALDHIYDASLKDTRPENLKKIIRATDIPILLWGLACAIYPNGYPYRRPCIASPTECQHVEEAMLYLPRLCWTDREALTHAQKKHMVNRRAKHTNEHVMLYQSDLKYGKKKTVEFTPKLKMILRVPSIEEYITSGYSWIESIVNMIEENFGSTAKGEDRERRIMAQGNVTMLRQFAHWVDKILVTLPSGDENYIDSRDTIDRILTTLTGQDELRDKFFEEVGNYIDYSTISMIGIPRYSCPSCGKPQGDESDSSHRYIIPVDVTNVFFTLQRRRIILGA
jgi:hypothetical protein